MILEVKNLEYSYPKAQRTTFHDVSFSLEKGDVLTILGPNGAGKSTLLNCLANVLTPTGGEVLLAGQNIRSMGVREVAKLLGYVPQNHNAAYAYTVRDYIVMGRAPYLGMFQKPSEADYDLAEQVMADMGILKFADKAYTQISGGERQQATIARAIVQQPEIIMFDEPTNHLDYGNQFRAVKMIKNLSQQGFTVIVTTHMPDHAMLLGGKSAILDYDGVLTVGRTEDILQEELLRKIYRADLHVIHVNEIRRNICVCGSLDEEGCPICAAGREGNTAPCCDEAHDHH